MRRARWRGSFPLGSVNQVLKRGDCERWPPDDSACLEVDLVHDVPRVAPCEVGEAGYSDRLEAGQHALAAEVYPAHLLAF
jgi:hypothetical protein